LFIIKQQLLAYEINYLVTQPTKTLLTRPHSLPSAVKQQI